MSVETKTTGVQRDSTRVAESPALRGAFASLLERLREETQRLYGDRLITLAVFGSVGRGTATVESDIDLLIVATDLPRGRVNRVSEFHQVEHRLQEDLWQMEQAGVHTYLSPIIKTPEEVRLRSPLFLDMIFDALSLYDKENFFQNFLADFKARLDHLGAKRIFRGDQWYWDLKPDYQIGDVFEL